jgi:hypothetical protein
LSLFEEISGQIDHSDHRHNEHEDFSKAKHSQILPSEMNGQQFNMSDNRALIIEACAACAEGLIPFFPQMAVFLI